MPEGFAKRFVESYQFGMKDAVRGHDAVSFLIAQGRTCVLASAHSKAGGNSERVKRLLLREECATYSAGENSSLTRERRTLEVAVISEGGAACRGNLRPSIRYR
jgi:hypothetical protein